MTRIRDSTPGFDLYGIVPTPPTAPTSTARSTAPLISIPDRASKISRAPPTKAILLSACCRTTLWHGRLRRVGPALEIRNECWRSIARAMSPQAGFAHTGRDLHRAWHSDGEVSDSSNCPPSNALVLTTRAGRISASNCATFCSTSGFCWTTIAPATRWIDPSPGGSQLVGSTRRGKLWASSSAQSLQKPSTRTAAAPNGKRQTAAERLSVAPVARRGTVRLGLIGGGMGGGMFLVPTKTLRSRLRMHSHQRGRGPSPRMYAAGTPRICLGVANECGFEAIGPRV